MTRNLWVADRGVFHRCVAGSPWEGIDVCCGAVLDPAVSRSWYHVDDASGPTAAPVVGKLCPTCRRIGDGLEALGRIGQAFAAGGLAEEVRRVAG